MLRLQSKSRRSRYSHRCHIACPSNSGRKRKGRTSHTKCLSRMFRKCRHSRPSRTPCPYKSAYSIGQLQRRPARYCRTRRSHCSRQDRTAFRRNSACRTDTFPAHYSWSLRCSFRNCRRIHSTRSPFQRMPECSRRRCLDGWARIALRRTPCRWQCSRDTTSRFHRKRRRMFLGRFRPTRSIPVSSCSECNLQRGSSGSQTRTPRKRRVRRGG
jgi:hypothetical protein